MHKLFTCLAAATLLQATPALAADAANGRKLAEQNCARCHAIDKGAGFKLYPPSFQSIAIYRAYEDIWSRIVAPSPHRGMPDLSWALSPDNVQDLLAYIVSLDTPVSIPK